MKGTLKKAKQVVILCLLSLLFSSCILDEFKFSEIEMKEGWKMDVVSPLFKGNFEFKDLILDSVFVDVESGEQTINLICSADSVLIVPTSLVFSPTILTEDYEFLIGGGYNLVSVTLEYTVSNGAPFPLNFQMRFHNHNSNVKGPPILPTSFIAATGSGLNFIPQVSQQTLSLNQEQLESLKTSKLVELSAWFDSSDIINQQSDFRADYPVEISITLYGEVD